MRTETLEYHLFDPINPHSVELPLETRDHVSSLLGRSITASLIGDSGYLTEIDSPFLKDPDFNRFLMDYAGTGFGVALILPLVTLHVAKIIAEGNPSYAPILPGIVSADDTYNEFYQSAK